MYVRDCFGWYRVNVDNVLTGLSVCVGVFGAKDGDGLKKNMELTS